MEIQISAQLALFGQSVLLGLGSAVLYDLLRAVRLRLPRATAVLDTVYCLCVGTGLFLFVLRRSAGLLRGYVLLGGLGGAVLYFCLLSALLRPVWSFWVDTLAFLAHLLTFPLVWTKNFLKKIAISGKNIFYFTWKCYTIRKTGRKSFKEGSVGPHGKTKAPSGAVKSHDQNPGAGPAGRNRLAAPRTAGPGGDRTGKKRRSGRAGRDPAAGK